METFEQVLTSCIADIRSGESTLDQCLDRYASMRPELEPLLRLAANVRGIPGVNLEPAYKASARAQLMQQIRASRRKRQWTLAGALDSLRSPQFAWARVVGIVLAGIVVLSAVAGGTAYAAQTSLPGELLYPVKTATERVMLLMASDSPSRARLYLQFAEDRLREMKAVSSRSERATRLAVSRYDDDLAGALEQLQLASDSSVAPDMLDFAAQRLQDQISFCDGIIDSSPPYMEAAREAGALSVYAQVRALEMLSQHDALRAAGTSTQSMQSRLQRAREKAGQGDYQAMQQLLLQYQQFLRLGESVLENARGPDNHVAEIEIMTMQALSRGLPILNELSQMAPSEYQSSIDATGQMMNRLQMQLRQGQDGQGQQGGGPPAGGGSAPSDDGSDGQGPRGGSGSQDVSDSATPSPPPSSPPVGGGGGGSDNGTGSGNGGSPGGQGGSSGEGGVNGQDPGGDPNGPGGPPP